MVSPSFSETKESSPHRRAGRTPYSHFSVYYGLFYRSSPAIFVFQLAPLDTGQGILQFLGQLTDLEIVDDNGIVFVYELADWRYNSCCTGTECLFQCAVMACFHQVVD